MKTKKCPETEAKIKDSVPGEKSLLPNSADSESSAMKESMEPKMTKLKDKTCSRVDSNARKSSSSEVPQVPRRSTRKVMPSPKHNKGDAKTMLKLKTSLSTVRQQKSHDMSSSSDEDTVTKSPSRHKMSLTRHSIPQGIDNADTNSSSADSDTTPEIVSTRKTEIRDQKAAKRRSYRKRNSLQTGSKSNVSTSDSETESRETVLKSLGKNRKKRSLETSGKHSGVEFNMSDASIHTLEGDIKDYQLCLIKMPADLPETSFPEVIMLHGMQEFSRKKKNYELLSFPDAIVQRDFITLLHSESDTLEQGPRLQGQTQIITKPSQAFHAVTAPLITHKPVPFPTGLKVRFTPFGADTPDVKDISSHRKKHRKRKSSDNLHQTLSTTEETDGSPKKKKKKKKHKHSSE